MFVTGKLSVYGAGRALPISTPSCKKATFATVALSLAAAVRISVPFDVKKSPLVVSSTLGAV